MNGQHPSDPCDARERPSETAQLVTMRPGNSESSLGSVGLLLWSDFYVYHHTYTPRTTDPTHRRVER